MELVFVFFFACGYSYVCWFLIPKAIDYLFKKYREYREKKKPKEEEPIIVFLFKV